MIHPDDTIAAISTPLGEGGLAVVRVSGRDALAVVDRCFEPSGRSSVTPSQAATHTIHYGRIRAAGQLVDEVLVGVLRAPRTYTREDVVEISCHGGLLPAKRVLEAVLAAGARLAHPGEFTLRAFLNGRLDLAQAEAVADVIHARTELALAAAEQQLAGSLSRRIHRLRDDLLGVLAHVEAQLDFPEEDIAPDTQSRLLDRMQAVAKFIEELLRTANHGQVLRHGIRAAIVGRPNVGKSSLLNQLLGRDRAIVSPLPGTTRDTIEEMANIGGIPVVFVDTAGLRTANDLVEQEGVRRSQAAAREAELILQVLDASTPWGTEEAAQLASGSGARQLVVVNKCDLPSKLELPAPLGRDAVRVSCLTGTGIAELKQAIRGKVWSGEVHAEMLEVMINSRHQDALRRALASLTQAVAALQEGITLELAAADLRVAVNAVGEVVGKTATEDLLDRIFGEFCLGK